MAGCSARSTDERSAGAWPWEASLVEDGRLWLTAACAGMVSTAGTHWNEAVARRAALAVAQLTSSSSSSSSELPGANFRYDHRRTERTFEVRSSTLQVTPTPRVRGVNLTVTNLTVKLVI